MVVQLKILLAVVFIFIVIDVFTCFVVILRRFKRFRGRIGKGANSSHSEKKKRKKKENEKDMKVGWGGGGGVCFLLW